MRTKLSIFILLCFLSITWGSRASNVLIDSMPVLRSAEGNAQIVFNISWDNSWRMAKPYNNWDAVWVFAKFKDATNNWQHVYLQSTGHTVAQTNGVTPEFKIGTSLSEGNTRNVGVFIYRADLGSGSINWRDVALLWNYGAQTSTSLNNIKIDVFALEMVYIPQAPFYLGSGSPGYVTPFNANWTEVAAFCYADDSRRPYLVDSEDPILLSNDVTKTTALGSKTSTGAGLWNTTGEITNEISLPATFPKGYKAFYTMKYELTQESYKDFLNFIPENQQLIRTRITSLVAAEDKYIFPSVSANISYRNGIMLIQIAGEYKFICNYRRDVSLTLVEDADRTNDGQNIPMNYLTLEDALAYLDWSGLRPLTELEFEKMARGTANPKVNEMVWGTTYYLSCGNPDATAYMSGTGKEAPNTGNFNSTGYPIRSGSFANSKTSRAPAGAGFYGNMELTGNVSERYINIHYSGAHTFTGEHGDGTLEADGKASEVDLLWSILPQHYIYRGGYNGSYIGTSDRYYYLLNRTPITADNTTGCRGGRTAQ